jgi:hypothetical protein
MLQWVEGTNHSDRARSPRGYSVNGLYRDRRRKVSDEENLKFRAARAAESVWKGKVIIDINTEAYMKKTIVRSNLGGSAIGAVTLK